MPTTLGSASGPRWGPSPPSGRAHLTHDGSVEGGATRARADRESRIASPVRPTPRASEASDAATSPGVRDAASGLGQRRHRVGACRRRGRRCGPRETDVGYRTRSGRRRILSGCLRVHFGVPPAADVAAAACPRARARARGVRGIGSGTRPGVHAKDISVEPGAAAAVNAASRSRASSDSTRRPYGIITHTLCRTSFHS